MWELSNDFVEAVEHLAKSLRWPWVDAGHLPPTDEEDPGFG